MLAGSANFTIWKINLFYNGSYQTDCKVEKNSYINFILFFQVVKATLFLAGSLGAGGRRRVSFDLAMSLEFISHLEISVVLCHRIINLRKVEKQRKTDEIKY